MKRLAAWAVFAAAGAGCSYDLDALQRGSDGAVTDRGAAVDTGPTIDAGTDAGAEAAVDVSPPRDVHHGTCALDGGGGAVRLSRGAQWGMIQTTTSGGPALRLPTGGAVPGCGTMDGVVAPPTQVFEWRVSKGSRIAATTNTSFCDGIDTRVYAVWSCGSADLNNPAGCNDDLAAPAAPLCLMCSPATGRNCASTTSLLDLPVSTGETVFFAVNGYTPAGGGGTNVGAFRLWVGENPAQIVPLPSSGSTVDRCPCQASTGMASTVAFPDGSVVDGFPVALDLAQSVRSVLASRAVADHPSGGRVVGVSAQFGLRAVNLNAANPQCAATAATFDLFIDGRAVTSFSIPPSYAPPFTFTVPYTGFAPVMVSATFTAELRLRSLSTAPDCATYEFDRATGAQNPNALSLYFEP